MPLLSLPDYHHDLQETRLPVAKRNKRLASVEFLAEPLPRNPSGGCPQYYGTSALSGVAVWPEFEVTDAEGDTVVRLSQNTNQPHGGYLFGSAVVGSRRSTSATACQVASMAMCYGSAGFDCPVDSLNAHLQRNKGYEPSEVAIVTWVSSTGDTIRYTPYTKDGTQLTIGDRFLVERGHYTNPLATFEVKSPGLAELRERHNPSTPVVRGDIGRVYWKMIPRIADKYTHDPELVSAELGASPRLPAQVESLLVRNIPVQLNLVTHGHFVVADGWLPSFRPGSTARGTYSIKDPYDPRDFTRLIESRVVNGKLADYKNEFRLARYVVPASTSRPLAVAGVATVGDSVVGLSILMDGVHRVELVDPLGRRLLRDAGTGEDVSEVPGAWIEDVGSEHDNGEDWDGAQTGYSIDVPEALDGDYLLSLHSENGYALGASAYDATGVFASDAAGDTTVGATGNVYDVHYSSSSRTVAVTWRGLATVQPPGPPLVGCRLGVRRNPAVSSVEFVIGSASAAGDAIEVFDINGRMVDVLRLEPGRRGVSWSCGRAGCPAGVYFARLQSGNGTVRFVVLR